MLIILSDRVKSVNSSTKIKINDYIEYILIIKKIRLFKILFVKLLLPNIFFLFIDNKAKNY